MLSLTNQSGLLIFLDVSCPTADVMGVYFVVQFSIEKPPIIGSRNILTRTHEYISKTGRSWAMAEHESIKSI
jgi:hypothetical protein